MKLNRIPRSLRPVRQARDVPGPQGIFGGTVEELGAEPYSEGSCRVAGEGGRDL